MRGGDKKKMVEFTQDEKDFLDWFMNEFEPEEEPEEESDEEEE